MEIKIFGYYISISKAKPDWESKVIREVDRQFRAFVHNRLAQGIDLSTIAGKIERIKIMRGKANYLIPFGVLDKTPDSASPSLSAAKLFVEAHWTD